MRRQDNKFRCRLEFRSTLKCEMATSVLFIQLQHTKIQCCQPGVTQENNPVFAPMTHAVRQSDSVIIQQELPVHSQPLLPHPWRQATTRTDLKALLDTHVLGTCFRDKCILGRFRFPFSICNKPETGFTQRIAFASHSPFGTAHRKKMKDRNKNMVLTT